MQRTFGTSRDSSRSDPDKSFQKYIAGLRQFRESHNGVGLLMLTGMIFASVHNAKTCKKVGASKITGKLLLPILAVLSLRKAHECGMDKHLATKGLRPGSLEEANSLV